MEEQKTKKRLNSADFEVPLKEKGWNPYAAWAYHRAAQNIEELEESIREMHERNELEKIPGVGKSLAKTIAEFLSTGKCERLEGMKSEW